LIIHVPPQIRDRYLDREPETRRSVASASTPLNLGAWRTADGTVDVKI
jgi:hypothetical protein